MGVLVPIVYAERVADPRRVAAMYRALGADEVQVAGFRPTNDAELARLVTALAPGRDARVQVARGRFTPAAMDALAAVVAERPGYLAAGTADLSLRVWPTHAWVHEREVPRGGVAALAAVASRVLGAPAAGGYGAGTTTLADDTRVTIEPAPDGTFARAVAFDVRTPRREAALALFAALLGDAGAPAFGLVVCPTSATNDALLAWLRALGGEVSGELVLPCEQAAALAVDVPGELDWQACDVMVRLPEGEVSTYLLLPFSPEKEAAFHARVRAALRAVDEPGAR